MANTRLPTIATITAQNTGTDWLLLPAGGAATLQVSGTFVAVITLQFRFGDESAVHDVETYTAATLRNFLTYSPGQVRLFCKTGSFTSGAAVIEARPGKQRE